MLSHSTLGSSRFTEDQFIADLTSLFRRRNISFGDPSDLERLGSDLLADDAFRGGLFNLCTVISHMAEEELTPQQLLTLVARASGGPAIFDAEGKPTIPQHTETTFLAGYDAWTKRGTGSDAAMDRWSSGPFHTAMTLSAAEGGFRTEPHYHPTTPSSPRTIPSNAPLDSLTIGELRQYLDEIERRVSRIEPQLEQPAPKPSPSAEYFEQLDAEGSLRVFEIEPRPTDAPPNLDAAPDSREVEEANESISTEQSASPEVGHEALPAPEPEPSALSVIIPSQPELDLPPQSRSLFLIPETLPPSKDITPDVGRVSRLRITIVVLAILLAIAIAYAAVFALRSMKSQVGVNQPLRIIVRDPAPSLETALPSLPGTKSAHPTPAAARPPQTSQAKPSAATPSPVAASPQPAVQPDTTAPAPITRQSPEPASAEPTKAAAALPTPPPADIKPAESSARPEQNPAPPPSRVAPAPAPPQTAEVRSAAPAAAPATAPAPIQRTQPASMPVNVSSGKMMAYALTVPAPVNPEIGHNFADSTVEVVAIISREGKVTSAQAVSGSQDVRAAATQAMLDARFKPYLVDGKPVEVVTTFRFLFKGQ